MLEYVLYSLELTCFEYVSYSHDLTSVKRRENDEKI